MTKQEIENRIAELKSEIRYEKRKMKYCAYGTNDLMYLYGLEQELENLKINLKQWRIK